MIINAYAVDTAGSSLKPFSYEQGEIGSHEVLLAISHCGICHSDVHLIDNDWGVSSYPLVPGHEIVGEIVAIGANVRHLTVGQRVGVGWQRAACLECQQCTSGNDNLCDKKTATCVGNFGGFADHIAIDSRYAFPIPSNLPSEQVAPLMCGGITVFSPLEHFQVRPWMRVGVIGLGGLGHLAVRFARAFGCEVTVFSNSSSKAEEAIRLGAHDFVSSTDVKALRKVKGKLNFIISTSNAQLEWSSFLSALAPDGNLCLVGVPEGDLRISVGNLLGGRKSLSASPIGSRHMISRMLDFSARHQILADTEIFEISDVNNAIAHLRSNSARFRVVLRVS